MNQVFEKIKERVKQEPFARLLGITVKEIGVGRAVVEMRFQPQMENIYGMAHGGAVFSLVDEAFEIASNSHGTVAVALNMTITYIGSPRPRSVLRAEANEISLTTRTASYLINVTDDTGTLLATCQALVYRKGEPIPFLDQHDAAT